MRLLEADLIQTGGLERLLPLNSTATALELSLNGSDTLNPR